MIKKILASITNLFICLLFSCICYSQETLDETDYSKRPNWSEKQRSDRMFSIMVQKGMLKEEKVKYYSTRMLPNEVFETKYKNRVLSFYSLEYGKYFMHVMDFQTYDDMRNGKCQRRAGYIEMVKRCGSDWFEIKEDIFRKGEWKGRTEYFWSGTDCSYYDTEIMLIDQKTGEKITLDKPNQFFNAWLKIGHVYMKDYLEKRFKVQPGDPHHGFEFSDWNLKTFIEIYSVMGKTELDRALSEKRITKELYYKYLPSLNLPKLSFLIAE